MVKVAEVLGDKIDRLSVRVDEGYGNDLQVVIDRMGDAIQAMSTRSALPPDDQANRTVAAPRLIGHSVVPSRSSLTQVSSVAVRASASSGRTRPPASISSPMNTGARNCAESCSDGRGVAAGPRR